MFDSAFCIKEQSLCGFNWTMLAFVGSIVNIDSCFLT